MLWVLQPSQRRQGGMPGHALLASLFQQELPEWPGGGGICGVGGGGGIWVVLEVRVPFRVAVYKGAVLEIGDRKSNPNLENYPYGFRVEGTRRQGRGRGKGRLLHTVAGRLLLLLMLMMLVMVTMLVLLYRWLWAHRDGAVHVLPNKTETGTARSFALERFAAASPANRCVRRLWVTQTIERQPLITNNPLTTTIRELT